MHEPPLFDAIAPDDFRRVREVFESALEQPPIGRGAFVARALSGSPALITEVQRMLAAETTAYPLLDDGPQLAAAGLPTGIVFANNLFIDNGRFAIDGGGRDAYYFQPGTMNESTALTSPAPARR